MSGYGNIIQHQIYSQPSVEKEEQYPVAFEDWEKLAREKLKDGPFWYVAGGAGSGETMKANRDAFTKQKIQPRMLNDVDERDLSVTLFGQTFQTPILLAPVGVQSIVHDQGELASAKAASNMNIPYITSTASSYTMEEIADVIGEGPRWYQLYWGKDEDVTASMLHRAKRAGYTALVVTLDTPILGWREKDLEQAYLPFLQGIGIANYLSDPMFCSKLEKSPQEDRRAAIEYFFKIFSNARLTWSDLAFLRKHWDLPIILKGIIHPRDAELALQYGVDGIIVSNHGGRQVDGEISTLDALESICHVIGGKIPVLLDSGIRRGSDVVKASALGASAVLLGRPFVYGLAVGGEEGVKHAIRNIIADTDLTLALSGRNSIKNLDRSLLSNVPDAQSTVRSESL
ncbi:lactate 2-monooxygenase [Desertibacillus haloalkaliphilus]|uniref:lactate 2-monooxygenase n=1 Tax=Desertibacillus haloalkaliphilus TaxID=1328930 RepID=UPI001C26F5C8|nr:lactate 2-monooxygenase [Desertibacillus haloalkaliphilus]MBU8906073.1 lactate 2-monooxygenase [Desertibacillus haloalkaliphilus]